MNHNFIPNRKFKTCADSHSSNSCLDCFAQKIHQKTISTRISLGLSNDLILTDSTNGLIFRDWLNNLTNVELKVLLWRSNTPVLENAYICRNACFCLAIETMAELQYDIRYMIKADMVQVLMYIYYEKFKIRVRILRPNHNVYQLIGVKYDIKSFYKPDITSECFECPICINAECNLQEKVTLNCSHTLCNSCLVEYFENLSKNRLLISPRCSLCREKITELTFTNTNNQQKMNKYIK